MAERVLEDGYYWIPRAGRLWGDYPTIANYLGLANEAAARNYVFRHGLKTIRHGRCAIVEKAAIDREALAGEAA